MSLEHDSICAFADLGHVVEIFNLHGSESDAALTPTRTRQITHLSTPKQSDKLFKIMC